MRATLGPALTRSTRRGTGVASALSRRRIAASGTPEIRMDTKELEALNAHAEKVAGKLGVRAAVALVAPERSLRASITWTSHRQRAVPRP